MHSFTTLLNWLCLPLRYSRSTAKRTSDDFVWSHYVKTFVAFQTLNRLRTTPLRRLRLNTYMNKQFLCAVGAPNGLYKEACLLNVHLALPLRRFYHR